MKININRKTMRAIKPGTYANIPNELYHAGEGISSSQIKDYLKNPALYKAKYVSNSIEKKDPTPALLIGSATHTAILEPHLFDGEYVQAPEINRRTKEGKIQFAEFEEANKNKIILKADDMVKIKEMSKSMAEHRLHKLLDNTVPELTVVAECPDTGLLLKCRPDALHTEYCLDVKTTADASPSGFAKSIFNFGYHISAAYYLKVLRLAGIECNSFIFACVESSAPYLCSFYELDQESLAIGEELVNKALQGIVEAQAFNEYKGYNDDLIMPISIPNWAKNQMKVS